MTPPISKVCRNLSVAALAGAIVVLYCPVSCFGQPPEPDPVEIGPGDNPPPLALSLTLNAAPNPVLVGKTVTVNAAAAGGAPPYDYRWFHACEGEPVGQLVPSPRSAVLQFIVPYQIQRARQGTLR